MLEKWSNLIFIGAASVTHTATATATTSAYLFIELGLTARAVIKVRIVRLADATSLVVLVIAITSQPSGVDLNDTLPSFSI